MKKRLLIALMLLSSVALTVQAQTKAEKPKMSPEMTEQWEPKPPLIVPGKANPEVFIPAPSDAIVLFDGSDLSEWRGGDDLSKVKGKDLDNYKAPEGSQAGWTVKNGVLTVNKEAGDIQTKREFEDFQLHIEWKVPKGIHGKGQGRGNSGIFLQGLYELQVLDSYQNETYVNGQAASIYKQTSPLANAMRPPGEWNVYDIIYTAPSFRKDGRYKNPPVVTVIHNGVLVQHNTVIRGTTPYIGLPQVAPHGPGPIRLQAHGDPSEPISFRNIWIREL